MSLILYYGSGSPYAWRVQFALEHKALRYGLKILSFSAGDTRKPDFIALNPRHQVPVLVDGDFVLYESSAIVEYLDEAYPASGSRLFPGDPQTRAFVRRIVLEIDNYVVPAFNSMFEEAFFVKPEERNLDRFAKGRAELLEELALFARYLRGDFFAGELSAADFTLYPFVAALARIQKKLPDFDAGAMLTPALTAWKGRVEALPYFEGTVPPHWKPG